MRCAGAIDIGGTHTKLGIVTEDGKIVAQGTVPTGEAGEPEPLIERIAETFRPMLAEARAGGNLVPAVGVSVAGFIDPDRSAMFGNANLPALCDFPLRLALVAALRIDCRLEVDSNAALLAEQRYGATNGSSRTVGVTVGTGLGGAVVVDGALLRYTGECAGDIGHIIVEPEGRPCSCGARGCLEALVSAGALSERGGGRAVSEIIAAAEAGEKDATQALGTTGQWLGFGLASLVPLFAPDSIVVGGGVSAAGELLLGPVRDSFHAHAAPAFAQSVSIVRSEMRGWAGVVGAAVCVFDPELAG
jgi:glucokinase